MPKQGFIAAAAVGYTALRSHSGACLEDHGPKVVLPTSRRVQARMPPKCFQIEYRRSPQLVSE